MSRLQAVSVHGSLGVKQYISSRFTALPAREIRSAQLTTGARVERVPALQAA